MSSMQTNRSLKRLETDNLRSFVLSMSRLDILIERMDDQYQASWGTHKSVWSKFLWICIADLLKEMSETTSVVTISMEKHE